MRAVNVLIVNLDNVPNNMPITRPMPDASVYPFAFSRNDYPDQIRMRIYVYLIGSLVATHHEELRRMITSVVAWYQTWTKYFLFSTCRKLEILVIFGFRAPVPGYQMDGYMASGFVLYPYVSVVGPNKHDCSRTRPRGNI